MDLANDHSSHAEGPGNLLACCTALRALLAWQVHAISSCPCSPHMFLTAMQPPWAASSLAWRPAKSCLVKLNHMLSCNPTPSAFVTLTNVHVGHATGLGRLQPIIIVGGPANVCGGQDVHLRVPRKVFQRVFEPHCSQLDRQSAMRRAGISQHRELRQWLGPLAVPVQAPDTGQVACYNLGRRRLMLNRAAGMPQGQSQAMPKSTGPCLNKQVAGCRVCLNPTTPARQALRPCRHNAAGVAHVNI